MHVISSTETFSSLELDDFEVQPLPKEVDNRGYIYVVIDKAFPSHTKIGRTQSIKKRLMAYNADKPFPTTSLKIISAEFVNVNQVEKAILDKLYAATPPSTFSREWFDSAWAPMMEELIKEAESYFELTNA